MAHVNPPTITAAKIEECLDKLAFFMNRSKDPSAYLPIWKRLENELAMRRDVDDMLAVARARLKQSKHQTGARS
ncbi:hypothetical protein V9K92_10250 [Phyllobacterium sp. CCNWLW109]|uniref:hypothetical protein n=1 Tax=Phyllobacterium sp. CCNWLW109 TaxID=3127479 RepID=UPI0030784AED